MERREALKKMSLAMGGALSATTMTAVLSHCTGKRNESETTSLPSGILDEDDFEIVSRISDRIIPATDTPGAIGANVPEWIEMMLNECYDRSNQNKFKTGLDKFRSTYSNSHSKNISQISSEALEEFLTEYEIEVHRDSSRDAESFFIRTVKELTLLGYFTSEPGATKALKYIPVPAKYEPCKPLEDEKAWATS